MYLNLKFSPLPTFHWFVIDLNVNFYFHRVVQPWNREFVSHEFVCSLALPGKVHSHAHLNLISSFTLLMAAVITFHARAISVEFVKCKIWICLKRKSFSNFLKKIQLEREIQLFCKIQEIRSLTVSTNTAMNVVNNGRHVAVLFVPMMSHRYRLLTPFKSHHR